MTVAESELILSPSTKDVNLVQDPGKVVNESEVLTLKIFGAIVKSFKR